MYEKAVAKWHSFSLGVADFLNLGKLIFTK